MTQIRKVKCLSPDCPWEKLHKMSDWIREYLPDSSIGFLVTDIDFVFYNYMTKKIALIEVKTNNSQVARWQFGILQHVAQCIQKGIYDGWQFAGLYLVRFEHTFFDDGKCYLNNTEVTEQQLKDAFSRI